MQNCWEFKRCGREPGGAGVAELGVCPAAITSEAHGANGGERGGGICWAVAGTLCGGRIRGTFAEKMLACMQCDFFDFVRRETGASFRLLPDRRGREEAIATAEAAQRALIDQYQALTSVLDEVNAIAYVADFETYEILYANRYVADLFGSDCVGEPCYRVLQAGQESRCSFCTNDRLVVDGKAAGPVMRELRNTVNGRWFLCLDRAIRWVDGRLVRMEVAVDITERKRNEEATAFLADASKVLARSLDRQATLDAVAQLVVPRLADWCVIVVGDQDGCLGPIEVTCAETGQEELRNAWRSCCGESKGRLCERVLRTGKPELVPDVSDEDLADAACDPAQLELLRRIHPRSLIAVPLIARGRTLGVLTLFASGARRRYDETDLFLAEHLGSRAALALANAELYETAQRAVRAREDVLAIVAHDLRNPLSGITLITELVERIPLADASGEQVRKKMEVIRRGVDQMEKLIADLLCAATIESGHLSVTRSLHDARGLVTEAVEMMEPLAREKKLRLQVRLDDELPAIECDHDRLIEVFSNLLGNAIKFTPSSGAVSVRARRNGPAVLFAVEDSGPGIAEDAVPRLFDRYWQGKNARRAGAGLGLYIVKGIVEAHGGRVWAESRPGAGSTFSFTIPGRMSATRDAAPLELVAGRSGA